MSTYRWWARRTETVSGAIVEAIGADMPGRLLLADPFAGGGVIALATLLRGHRVYAQDINPWAAHSLHTMLTLPAPDQLEAAASRLYDYASDVLDAAYSTLMANGTRATIVHTLRVATGPCPQCQSSLRLFPTALVSMLNRVDCDGYDEAYVACRAGHLHLASATKQSNCPTCRRRIVPTAKYTADRSVQCHSCCWKGKLSDIAEPGGFGWEPVLVERLSRLRREIAPPTPRERAQADSVEWKAATELPEIGPGPESAVLRRHGMRYWHDLYPQRQRVVIEALLEGCAAAAEGDAAVESALRAAVIGSVEMAGFASRWDARYLKAYEAVANHRFNFTTLAVEPNVWGAGEAGRGTVSRRVTHVAKASAWLEEHVGRSLTVQGPKASDDRRTALAAGLDARVVVGSSERLNVTTGSVDAIVTDPPYHDDVHYAELSDLFRSWAGETTGALDGDAIVNRKTGDVGTDAYQRLLTRVFREMRRALRPGGHLVLSYANRHPGAWIALLMALADAGYQAVGYTIVHSENELDHAKVGRRACTLDVLLDLVPAAEQPVRLYRPTATPSTPEEEFCRLVGEEALQIGTVRPADWAEQFTKSLRASAFLA